MGIAQRDDEFFFFLTEFEVPLLQAAKLVAIFFPD